MKWTSSLIVASPLIAPLGALPAADTPEPTGKPNIVFILVDDYGIQDVGVEGSRFYETPHIDTLARAGMRFTQGYAACPVCSPSRARRVSRARAPKPAPALRRISRRLGAGLMGRRGRRCC